VREGSESDTESDDEIFDLSVEYVLKRRRVAHVSAVRGQKIGPQGKKRNPFSSFSWTELHRLSGRDFNLRYRVDSATFDLLHGLIKSRIDTKNRAQVSDRCFPCTMFFLVQARRCRACGEVPSEVRLAVTPRFLAGGHPNPNNRYVRRVRAPLGCVWRPLEVKFRRRANLGGAAMRLHNYCIDLKIDCELRQFAGASEMKPGVWVPTPRFDQHGCPIDLHDTAKPCACP
jgi:hypothetical protein